MLPANWNQLSKRSIAAIVYIMIALFALTGAFFLFAELAEDVLEKERFAVDRVAADFMSSIQVDWLYTAMGWITELGSVPWLTAGSILLCIAIFFTYRRRWWRLVYFAAAMIGISILTKTLKLTFERERPDLLKQFDGTGFSFPSGHSTGPMVFYGFIIYLTMKSGLSKKKKWLLSGAFGVLILLIGFSRVYLSVHYATDVIGGFSLGLCWLIVCLFILEYTLWRKNSKKRS